MKRADLDSLDREALIRLAESHGVSRARILTRPELVDEILLRRAATEGDTDVSIARGFFGLARDLVASVVERGLHLPDAATKIRGIHLDVPKRFTPPAVLPTVTLAQIYASQGHTKRAIDTLQKVLEAEPEHADARDLLRRLQDDTYVPPKEPLPPEDDAAREAYPPDDESAPRGESPSEPVPAPAQSAATLSSEPVGGAPREPEEQAAAAAPETETKAADSGEDETRRLPKRAATEAPAAGLGVGVGVGVGVEGALDEAAEEPSPVTKPAETEPPREPVPSMLDDEPLPPKYDVDECVALPVDPTSLFVYWEIRDDLLLKVASLRGDGVLALRALVVEPGWHGPRTYVRDHDVSTTVGDYFLRELPSGAIVRVAVGYRTPTAFVPLAHSPHLSLPRGGPVARLATTLVRWTPVGVTEVDGDDPAAGFYARALRRVGELGLVDHGADVDLAAALGLPELGRLTLGGHDGSSGAAR